MKKLLILLFLLTPCLTYADDVLYDVELLPNKTIAMNLNEFETKTLKGKIPEYYGNDICPDEIAFLTFKKGRNYYQVWTRDQSLVTSLQTSNAHYGYVITVDDTRQIHYTSTVGFEEDKAIAKSYHPPVDLNELHRHTQKLYEREKLKRERKLGKNN